MKMNICNTKILYGTIVAIPILLSLFCVWQNNSIVTTSIEYNNKKIPDAFNGFTIVQISDLHNKSFGKDGKNLLDKVEKASPDIIVVTGDLIDRRHMDMDVAMNFINEAMKIAPVYYVTGNHEGWSGKYKEIKEELLSSGVIVLDDTSIEITKDEETIILMGLSDPAFITSKNSTETNTSQLEKNLKILSDTETFTILLSHRPEFFDIYIENNIDLVFAGHAHGGQIRLPLIGPILAPNQGMFPKYTTGSYTEDNTTMVVSRGLGNSVFPLRIFNRPEIVKVTLYNK